MARKRPRSPQRLRRRRPEREDAPFGLARDREVAATLDKHISEVLRHDPAIRRLTRAILRSQKQLRASASEEAWRTYLRLE